MFKLNNKAFSFPELLISVGILSIIMVGMVNVFVSASVLGELSENSGAAYDQAASVLDEIRHDGYDTAQINYVNGGSPGNTFALTKPVGMGVITLDTSTPNLLLVTIDVSYRNKYNRITGEDVNLNGVLDPTEDSNSNGKIDSPVSLTAYIAKR